jgi:hypothetical protein
VSPALSQDSSFRMESVRESEKLGRRVLPTYSVERNQFCSRSPLTRENSLSLSVTIT